MAGESALYQKAAVVPEPGWIRLRSTRNASALVCDAIRAYRARELARRLEVAYRADLSEAERINADWESADAEVSE